MIAGCTGECGVAEFGSRSGIKEKPAVSGFKPWRQIHSPLLQSSGKTTQSPFFFWCRLIVSYLNIRCTKMEMLILIQTFRSSKAIKWHGAKVFVQN